MHQFRVPYCPSKTEEVLKNIPTGWMLKDGKEYFDFADIDYQVDGKKMKFKVKDKDMKDKVIVKIWEHDIDSEYSTNEYSAQTIVDKYFDEKPH